MTSIELKISNPGQICSKRWAQQLIEELRDDARFVTAKIAITFSKGAPSQRIRYGKCTAAQRALPSYKRTKERVRRQDARAVQDITKLIERRVAAQRARC